MNRLKRLFWKIIGGREYTERAEIYYYQKRGEYFVRLTGTPSKTRLQIYATPSHKTLLGERLETFGDSLQ